MALFKIPEKPTVEKSAPKIKLKKGQTIFNLIEQADQLVNEKLGKYKDTSKCITNIEDLRNFFNNTEDDGIIRNRYGNNWTEHIPR